MTSPYTPANMLYYPPLDAAGKPSTSAIDNPARNLARIGQVAPKTYERMRKMHGRYLSGLGASDSSASPELAVDPPIGPQGEDPAYGENLLPALESEDDAFGSGIFDAPGTRPTSNADMGVFTSEYALPGYIKREVPYAVSRDVTDVIDGGQVVFVPGGGFFHMEYDSHRQPSPVLGPTPRPPRNVPAPLSTIAQPIVTMQPESAARMPLNALAPVRPMAAMRPAREVPSLLTNLRPDRHLTPLATSPAAQPLPYSQIVRAVGQTEGEQKPPASAGTMAVYGLILGASLGIVVGALRGGKPASFRLNRPRRHRRR